MLWLELSLKIPDSYERGEVAMRRWKETQTASEGSRATLVLTPWVEQDRPASMHDSHQHSAHDRENGVGF